MQQLRSAGSRRVHSEDVSLMSRNGRPDSEDDYLLSAATICQFGAKIDILGGHWTVQFCQHAVMRVHHNSQFITILKGKFSAKVGSKMRRHLHVGVLHSEFESEALQQTFSSQWAAERKQK